MLDEGQSLELEDDSLDEESLDHELLKDEESLEKEVGIRGSCGKSRCTCVLIADRFALVSHGVNASSRRN